MAIFDFLNAVYDKLEDYGFEDEFIKMYKNSDICSYLTSGSWYPLLTDEEAGFENIHYFNDKLKEVGRNENPRYTIETVIKPSSRIEVKLYFLDTLIYTLSTLRYDINSSKINSEFRVFIKQIEFNYYKLKKRLTDIQGVLKEAKHADSLQYYSSFSGKDDIVKLSVYMFLGTGNLNFFEWPEIIKKYNIDFDDVQYAIVNKYVYFIFYKRTTGGWIDIYMRKASFEIQQVNLMNETNYKYFIKQHNAFCNKIIGILN